MLQKKSFPTASSIEAVIIDKELVNQITLRMMDAVQYLKKTCTIPTMRKTDQTEEPDYQSASLLRGYDCPMNRQAVENAKFIVELYDKVME